MPSLQKKKKNQWLQLFADNAIYEPRNLLGFSSLDRWGYVGVSSPHAREAGTAGFLSLIHAPELSMIHEPSQKII